MKPAPITYYRRRALVLAGAKVQTLAGPRTAYRDAKVDVILTIDIEALVDLLVRKALGNKSRTSRALKGAIAIQAVEV